MQEETKNAEAQAQNSESLALPLKNPLAISDDTPYCIDDVNAKKPRRPPPPDKFLDL
jgi:hypothetical protein